MFQYNTLHCARLQYNTIKYTTTRHNASQYNTMISMKHSPYNTTHLNAINTIPHNTIQSNSIEFNTTHYNTIQHNAIQYTNIIQGMRKGLNWQPKQHCIVLRFFAAFLTQVAWLMQVHAELRRYTWSLRSTIVVAQQLCQE